MKTCKTENILKTREANLVFSIANKVEMSKLEEFQKLLYARSDSTLEEVRTLTRRYEPAMEKVEGTLKTIVENLNKNISGLVIIICLCLLL